MRRTRFLRWLRAMLTTLFGCLFAVGCDPGQLDLSDLQPEVQASGGGDKIQKTRIPIEVEVAVREKSTRPSNGCNCTGDACPCCDTCACRHGTVITLPRDEFDFSGTSLREVSPKPQRPSDTRPVVFWVSDFGPGECGACEAVKGDWQRSGSTWPFRLEQRPRHESPVPVDGSPTFYWRDRSGTWRYWATGSSESLISTWHVSR